MRGIKLRKGVPNSISMATSLQCAGLLQMCLMCVWLLETNGELTSQSISLDDDVLPAYTEGHGPSHSHSHVREYQSATHGPITYETWPSSSDNKLPVAESTVFLSNTEGSSDTSRWVYGRMTVVHNPLRTLSVVEPGGPGGCEKENPRVSVEETAIRAGCLYAQNAGFFNTTTNKCLGNVVSDGRLVRDSRGMQNAQFGIRKDGSLVFGYLSQEDVLDQSNPFVQLVSGVVWLLRAGEVYINQSLKAECDKIVDMAVFRDFVDVLSARTVVGHDAKGNVVLFHVDGQTLKRGASDSRWRCPRTVSTVLCVHQRRCQPADCSGHGECVDGRCRCQDGWQGAACDSLVCQPPACGPHGVCTASGCVCAAGWRGKTCREECLPGYYGDGCRHTCICFNGASCSHVDGRCTCLPGFQGAFCEQVCPPGYYGLSCAEKCQCDGKCPCDPMTGSCAPFRSDKLNQAGLCLAQHMFTLWIRQHETDRSKPYLSEQTWLIITLTLTLLLLMRLLLHLMRASRRWLLFSYSYIHIPVNDVKKYALPGNLC